MSTISGLYFNPQKFYWFSMGIFSFIEISTVYSLYQGTDKNDNSGGLLNRANFKGWTATIKSNKSSTHMLHFYALWVANNKLIMVLLGNVIGLANTETRFYGSIAMTFGCLVYFYKMDPLLKKMQNDNELKENTNIANITATIIELSAEE
eukprot:306049_1